MRITYLVQSLQCLSCLAVTHASFGFLTFYRKHILRHTFSFMLLLQISHQSALTTSIQWWLSQTASIKISQSNMFTSKELSSSYRRWCYILTITAQAVIKKNMAADGGDWLLMMCRWCCCEYQTQFLLFLALEETEPPKKVNFRRRMLEKDKLFVKILFFRLKVY